MSNEQDHDHFAATVRHIGFLRGQETTVYTPGEEARTTKGGCEILFTIVGNEISESTGDWARVRWDILQALRKHGDLCLHALLELIDEDDHKFVSPSIGWHRNFGNVAAQRCDECGAVELALTPQGYRLARSN